MKMKAKPSQYRGIEFIAIEDLPLDQQNLLKLSFNPPELIKILIHGKGPQQCILYSVYSEWFKATYGNPKSKLTSSSLNKKEKEFSVVHKKNN